MCQFDTHRKILFILFQFELQVEIELGIDTKNPNYSKSKGEQIAINVDGTALGSSGSTYER